MDRQRKNERHRKIEEDGTKNVSIALDWDFVSANESTTVNDVLVEEPGLLAQCSGCCAEKFLEML